MGICICIGQVLEEPLREQPYQALASKYFLASAIVWGVDVCRWDESLGGGVSYFEVELGIVDYSN